MPNQKAPYGYTKSGNVRRKPTQAQIANSMSIRGKGKYYVGRPQIRGSGGYYTDLAKAYTKGWAGRAGSYLGAGLGYAAGSAIAPGIGGAGGGAIGANIGGAAGRKFAQITGWGDYKIHKNSLIRDGQMIPSFGTESIRVCRRECIAHINATTSFTNNTFPLNPGLNDTFPWLAPLASNFEQFKFHGLVFQFKSTSSDAIASTTNLGLGQVIMATDYNSNNAPYQDELQMLGASFANSGKPSQDILHAIECAPNETQSKLYNVRSGDVPTGADIRLYDWGVFQIATDNMPANYTGLGQLWVTYDVEFFKPVQNNQLGYDINTDRFTLTAPSTANPFGTAQAEAENSNLGCTFPASNTLAFPPTTESGYYQLTYNVNGATPGASALTVTGVNCTEVYTITNRGETTSSFVYTSIVRIDDRDASVLFTLAVLPTGASLSGNVVVTQVNGELEWQ